MHVDNVAEAISCGLAAADPVVRGETFLLGGESELTWAEYFACFSRELGIKPRVLPDEELASPQSAWLQLRAVARHTVSRRCVAWQNRGSPRHSPDESWRPGRCATSLQQESVCFRIAPANASGKILAVGPRIYMRDRDRSAVADIEFGLTRPGINSAKIERCSDIVQRWRGTVPWPKHWNGRGMHGLFPADGPSPHRVPWSLVVPDRATKPGAATL